MADKRPALGDAIRAAVPAVVRRSKTWDELIDADTLAELTAVRDDWRSGSLQGSKTSIAKAIANELNARGISDIGVQGVLSWLAKG